MSDQFVGEIRMFGGNFAPVSWFPCDGRLLPISEFDMLFNLIGTIYGGDGQSTFGLPDLRSRVPVGKGTDAGLSYVLGEMGGVELVTLTRDQLATHAHAFMSSADSASSSSPNNQVPASLPAAGTIRGYGLDQPYRTLEQHTVEPVGGNQPHDNVQPYLALNFIIAYDGIYPRPGDAAEAEGATGHE